MSVEIMLPGQDLRTGVEYQIWTEEEVSAYIARLHDINNLFNPHYSPDFPYRFSSDPDALLKPAKFAGSQIITRLGTNRVVIQNQTYFVPYPEDTLPLLESADELPSQDFPVYFSFEAGVLDQDDEMASRMVKNWVTAYTILAGNGVSASGELAVRSRLRRGDIESIHEWDPKQPIFIFPNNPLLISQTRIMLRENHQSIYKEEDPGRNPRRGFNF